MATSAATAYSSLSDEELLRLTRRDDVEAYAMLWRRHSEASRRVAIAVSGSANPDDLVAEAYTKTLETIRRGHGPVLHFRAYLATVIGTLAADWGRQSLRLTPVGMSDDLEHLVPAASGPEPDSGDGLVLSAFNRLPERSRMLLWYSVVEGYRPREIAPLFTMSVNATTVAASRARDALRTTWLQLHADTSAPVGPRCADTIARLGAYVRRRRASREDRAVEEHLERCADCRRVLDQLRGIDARLHASLAPVAAALGLAPVAAGPAVPAAPVAATSKVLLLKATSLLVCVVVSGAAVSAVVATLSAPPSPSAQTAARAPLPPPDAHAPTQDEGPVARPEAVPGTPDPSPAGGSGDEAAGRQGPGEVVGVEPATPAGLGVPTFDFPAGTVFGTATPLVGGTAEPGATVTTVLSGSAADYRVISATADPDGVWSFTVPELGATTFGVRAYQSVAGRGRSAIASSTFRVDDTSPTPLPVITEIDTGGGRYAPAVTGHGAPGAEITVLVNGAPTTGRVGDDGSWHVVATGDVRPGRNTVAATQTRRGTGTASPVTDPWQVTLTAPSATIVELTRSSLHVEILAVPGGAVGVLLPGAGGAEHIAVTTTGTSTVVLSPNVGAYDPADPPRVAVRYVSPDGLRAGPSVVAGPGG